VRPFAEIFSLHKPYGPETQSRDVQAPAIRLSIRRRLDGDERAMREQIDGAVLPLLLGRPFGSLSFSPVGSLAKWQHWRTDHRGLEAVLCLPQSTAPALETADGLLKWLCERIRQLREGALDAREAEAALRIAQVEQLVALDGPQAILAALEAGVLPPWRFTTSLPPAALSNRLAGQLRNSTILVEIVWPGELPPDHLERWNSLCDSVTVRWRNAAEVSPP
jgi:hypothetical protein